MYFYFIADYELITDYTITLSLYVNNPVCGTTAEFTAGPVRVHTLVKGLRVSTIQTMLRFN